MHAEPRVWWAMSRVQKVYKKKVVYFINEKAISKKVAFLLKTKIMKTNDHNSQSHNQPKENRKQQQVNEPQKDKNTAGKKPVYIKDMPPIDGARTGII